MRRRPAFLAGGLALVLGAGAVTALPRVANHLPPSLQTVAHLPERVAARMYPPHVSRKVRRADLTEPERAAAETVASRLDGLIAWSSNRSGHHDLYVLDLRTRDLRRLTHDPAVHFFPRFSPDGHRIVFLRSQREWVSGRDPTAWDVYLIDVDGANEQRIATGAYHSTWTADGRGIIYHRGTRVFRYELATQRETLLVDAATVLPGLEDDLGDAELAPEGRRLAFVLRGRFAGVAGLQGAVSGAAVLDLESHALTLLTREQACQTTWAPDGRDVVWMETGGNGGTRVMRGDAQGTDRHVFMDLPGAYSHEYFPKLSNDGRWLIWGAAAEGHEQDQADYEIFVWAVGTPWDQATRLTYHPGNDNWPDLWVRPHRDGAVLRGWDHQFVGVAASAGDRPDGALRRTEPLRDGEGDPGADLATLLKSERPRTRRTRIAPTPMKAIGERPRMVALRGRGLARTRSIIAPGLARAARIQG